MATQTNVKTENLPNTYSKKGCWYFRCSGVHVPLAGEYGDDTFMGHYYMLCEMYGVGAVPDDPRKVYFMGWLGGPIKIGLASDVAVRLCTLQVACPYELQVLAVTSGGLKGELDYHSRFSAYRLRGEWFERAPEIEAEIARLNELAEAA